MMSSSGIFRDFSFGAVVLRLLLAMAAAGTIGFDRSIKKRAAGLRTYMLIGVGAAMTVLISLYEYEMQITLWAPAVEAVGLKYDVSRFAAQVLSGIGFLGAGTIITVAHQQKAGLTTAAGLFATACMGMAAGAGFYECVIIALLMIFVVVAYMQPLEVGYKRRLRNIMICVELEDIENLSTVTDLITGRQVQVFDIDIEQAEREKKKIPTAIYTLRLPRSNTSHSEILSSIAELSCVVSVQELIA